MNPFYEAVQRDLKEIYEIREEAVYKSRDGTTKDITVFIQIGRSLDKGGVFDGNGSATMALIWITSDQIAIPKSGDSVTVNGTVWRVGRMDQSAPHRHIIEASTEGKAYA